METLSYDPLLKENESVKTLQRKLNAIRMTYHGKWDELDVDGLFGEDTDKAVKAFQRYVHLNDDGIVGDQTWAKIDDLFDFRPQLNSPIDIMMTNLGMVSTSPVTAQSSPEMSDIGMSIFPNGNLMFSLGVSKNEYMCPATPQLSELPEPMLTDSDGFPVEIMMNSSKVAVDGIGLGAILGSNYIMWNEVWHKTKNNGTAFRWQSRWNKHFAVEARTAQIGGVAGPRMLAKGATKLGGGLLVADIAMSGELKPSHAINGAMLAASTTGVGAVVAVGWLAADYGTMAYNRIFYGEWKSLSDIIDEKIGTFEMYEGLY